MVLRIARRTLLAVPTLLSSLLSACASAPAPASPPFVGSTEIAPPPLFCHPAARAVTFASVGVPPTDELQDVALGPDGRDVWVLFQPARVVRLRRDGDRVQAATKLGEPGELWTVLDVDPRDGSAWVASHRFALYNLAADDLRTTTVEIQRQIVGMGGFWRLIAAQDALYATPICSDGAVWRLDRDGRVLATDFALDEAAFAGLVTQGHDPERPPCFGATIERDFEGHILAWVPHEERLYRSDEAGAWAVVEKGLLTGFAGFRGLSGIEEGPEPGRYVYSRGASSRLFTWKGRLARLDPFISVDGRSGSTLAIEEGGTVREVPTACHGEPVLGVAVAGASYVAVTGRSVIFGELATAPDLP